MYYKNIQLISSSNIYELYTMTLQGHMSSVIHYTNSWISRRPLTSAITLFLL